MNLLTYYWFSSKLVAMNISTEAELIKKNYLLSLAEEMVMIGHWQWFLTTNEVLWSDNLYSLFHHEPESDITYDTYFGYVHPDDKEYVTECVTQSIADKKFHGFFHRILLKNGTVRTIHLMGKIFLDEDDNVVEMIGTCQDVTEQKEAELKLAESENLYRYLYDNAHSMHFSVRPTDGAIIKCNQTLRHNLGYETHEILNAPMYLLFPAEKKDVAGTFLDEFRKAVEVHNIETTLQRKNGSLVEVLLNASSVRNDSGEILYHRVSCIDVTEKVNSAKKLKLQNQRLSDFCSIISHNLRGPLSNISMIADYLKTTELNDMQLEMIGKLNGVLDHLNEIFNELVESISVRYDTEIISEEIHLEKVLKLIIKSFENQIKAYNASISIDFSNVTHIFYPRKYMESIFTNLLSNALKYKSPDRAPQIKISSQKRKGDIVLSVSDNGLGIDTELHKNNLFKIRKVFHEHPEARGFGLFMTKTQVEAMGGTIWVESKPDEGSTFYVSFPIPNT